MRFEPDARFEPGRDLLRRLLNREMTRARAIDVDRFERDRS